MFQVAIGEDVEILDGVPRGKGGSKMELDMPITSAFCYHVIILYLIWTIIMHYAYINPNVKN